jgi:hypothetical protein
MKFFFTLTLFSICISISAQTSSKKIQKKVQVGGTKSHTSAPIPIQSSNVEWLKKTTQKYSPVTWNLLEQYKLLPDKITSKSKDGATSSDVKSLTTFQFLEGKTKIELLQSMATNIHEVSHAYYRHNALSYAVKNNLPVNWNNAEGFIYLSPSQTYYISFPKARLFQSKNLATIIPAKLHTLRYSTYITGNTSTQSHGVIGLLNEFHAYYLGAKYSYDMMEAYCQAESSAAKGLQTWVQHSQSLMDAYYEFSFFIREYLLFMSQKHPKSYAQLKAYTPFWQAFNAIDKAYSDLNNQYQQRIRSQISVINKKEKNKLSIENNILWLNNGSSKRKGAPLALPAKQKLAARLKQLISLKN